MDDTPLAQSKMFSQVIVIGVIKRWVIKDQKAKDADMLNISRQESFITHFNKSDMFSSTRLHSFSISYIYFVAVFWKSTS